MVVVQRFYLCSKMPVHIDPQTISLLIIFHAIAGSIALFAGPGALIAMKGGRVHRTFGKLFFITMLITGGLALLISNLPGHKNFFLFTIGIFSIYMVSSGYRYLSLDNLHKGQKPLAIDWILTCVMALFSLVLIGGGIIQLLGLYTLMYNQSFGIVLVVFGFFSAAMVRQDINGFRGKVEYRNHFILVHISRMIGANIAAFTAFLVVNNHNILPAVVAWLLPTAIGIPISMYWQKKQKSLNGMKLEKKD
jgi:uncharacterized membrane protein